jgi:hypothetical protein
VRRPAVIALALALAASPALARDAPVADPAPQHAKTAPAKKPAGKVAPKPKPAPVAEPAPAAGPPEPPPPPTPPLLGFCAQPVRPECVDTVETYADPGKKAACNQDMERYVKYVFAFRLCLNAEMERAVRQTNETIFRHKCRMAGRKSCP